MTRPPVGSTGTLAELQVEAGDVVEFYNPTRGKITHTIDRIKGLAYISRSNGGVLGNSSPWTLISRANPDQPAHIITHEGRQYDLTALEAPFGLLPEPVQEALRDWPHGFSYYTEYDWLPLCGKPEWVVYRTYRAKPAPTETRVKCIRASFAYSDLVHVYETQEHGTCIKNPDGSIDWASWEDAQ